MEEVFQWAKNMVYYLIFSQLIVHLMPNGKYEQYMKLFSGAVFILLMTGPLTGVLHLNERLAHVYEQIQFEQEREEIRQPFEQQLSDMEQARIDRIMLQYEEAVASDAAAIAEEEGFFCVDSRAELGRQENEESFGRIVRISLTLCGEDEGDMEDSLPVSGAGNTVSAVEEIRVYAGTEIEVELESEAEIREGKEGNQEREEGTPERKEENPEGKEGNQERKEGNPERKEGVQEREAQTQEGLARVQRKVAEYYGLEEDAVQITWKDD